MKEELQGKLVEILTSIQTAAGKASDFALEQLPDIAQQYVVFGRVRSAAICFVFLMVAAFSFGFARWAYKHPWNTSRYSWDEGRKRSDSNVLAMILPTLGGLISLLIALTAFDWLVWFAPKVWLLKEIATLIK